MGIVIVEVCDVNPAAGLDLIRLEEEYPGVSVIETPCLSNCTICASTPFAYVNGELLANADRDMLWKEIKTAIEAELNSLES